MKYYLLLLVAFFMACTNAIAQNDKVIIHFVDTGSKSPLKNVSVMDKKGNEIAHSDTSGYAVFLLSYLDSSNYLLSFSPGYKLDTIRFPVATVSMQPLSAILKEAVIGSNKINKLLHAPDEYVVDYAFVDDKILVASYSGNNGGHAKLFLLDKAGKIITTCKLPAAEPISLYRSCVGRYYCVFYDKFYPLAIQDSSIQVLKPYDIKLLQGLQQCVCSINGDQYYKLTDKQNFYVAYGLIKKNTTKIKPIISFEEPDVAQASYNELMVILALLEARKFNEASRKQLLRNKWDRGSLAHINMPLIAKNDTLVVFDFFKKQLRLYGLSGDSIGHVPILFDWRQSQQFEVIQDEITGTIYIHRYGSQNAQTIEALSINGAATVSHTFTIEKPYAEQVKIYNGDIYFLWRDNAATSLRQLYVQRAE